MNYEEQLKSLKLDIDKAKVLKSRAEGTLEQLKNQETQILEELDRLGVKPENLDKEIEILKRDIEKMLKEANELMPREILDKVGKNG